MTVREMIDELQRQNPEAEVMLHRAGTNEVYDEFIVTNPMESSEITRFGEIPSTTVCEIRF